jgi:hypothetical protein
MILEEWVENHAASNFEATYKNAISAGFQEVDAYAFICNTCKGTHTAQQVIQGITGNLGSGFNGMIWLDIEPCSGCWSSNGEANFEFAKTIATTLQSQGHKIGIYSSGWAWSSVMPGVKSTYFAQFPLWYAHYDNVESFNDPNSYKFAGWTQPAMKQFLGDKQGQCNVPDYDIDWAPAFVNTNGPSKPSNNEEAKQQSQQSAAPSQGSQKSASAHSSQADANNSESKSSAQAANPNANTPSSDETSQSQQTNNNQSSAASSSAKQSSSSAKQSSSSAKQSSSSQKSSSAQQSSSSKKSSSKTSSQ